MIAVKGGLLQSPEERICSSIDLLYLESLLSRRIVHDADEEAHD
jgi:hypothetical protein